MSGVLKLVCQGLPSSHTGLAIRAVWGKWCGLSIWSGLCCHSGHDATASARCLVPHHDSAEDFPGQNGRSCENSEFRLKESFPKNIYCGLNYGLKWPLSKLVVENGVESRLEVESPKGNAGGKKHLNQLFIIVGFYNLKCK